MSQEEQNYAAEHNYTPYKFSEAIFKPFKSGPGSLGFVLKSALFYALVLTMLFAIFGRMIIGPYVELIALSIESVEQGSSEELDPKIMAKMISSMGDMMLGYIAITLGGWAIWSMIESALHRRVLRGENKTGLFPWRFGKDELRTMLSELILYFAYNGLFMVVYFAIIIGVLIAALMGSQNIILGVIGGIITAALFIAGFGVMFWVLIRLAPMAAVCVAEDDVAIDKTWRVAKGRAWPNFGAYAFHHIVSMIGLCIVGVAIVFAFLANMIPMIEQLGENVEPEDAMKVISQGFSEAGMSVGLIISGFIMAFLFAIWMMCVAGISSYVTKLYYDEQEADNHRIFD